jgi:hypothetical protein
VVLSALGLEPISYRLTSRCFALGQSAPPFPQRTGAAMSSTHVINTVHFLLSHGFKPVPLHHCSKAAIRPDYSSPAYDPPPLSYWDSKDIGVGAALGPQAGGLIDIDLDCAAARHFWPLFCPQPFASAVFGRKTAPRSHFIYRILDGEIRKEDFKDPLGAPPPSPSDPSPKSTIIEIRGDGEQTVFPGSLHESTRELIMWDPPSEYHDIPTVALDDLRVAARKTALAVLFTRHIYAPGFHNDPLMFFTGALAHAGWTQDDAEKFIVAVMEYGKDDDSSRLKTLRHTFARFNKDARVGGLGKLGALINNPPLIAGLRKLLYTSEAESIVDELNDKFALVFEGEHPSVYTLSPDRGPLGSSMNHLVRYEFPCQMWKAFEGYHENDTVKVGDKYMPKVRYWRRSPRCIRYNSTVFVPGGDQSRIAPDQFNLWPGWATPPVKGDFSYYKQLLATVCGDDDPLQTWVYNWLASVLRDPLDPAGTSLVIQGEPGAGKSLFAAYFGKVLGYPSYMSLSKGQLITGRFNEHMSKAVMLHGEEAAVSGDPKTVAFLKSLVTDPTRDEEGKGKQARVVGNHIRVIFTANDASTIQVQRGDRRYTFIDMKNRAFPKADVPALLHEMSNGGPAALHWHLMNELEYDRNIPRTNFKTSDFGDLQAKSMEPFEEFILTILHEQTVLPPELEWARVVLPHEIRDSAGDYVKRWPDGAVLSQALYRYYEMFMKGKSLSYRHRLISVYAFEKELRRYIPALITQDRHTPSSVAESPLPNTSPWWIKRPVNGKQYTFPPLEQARKDFDNVMKRTSEWPADLDKLDTADYVPFVPLPGGGRPEY